MTTSHEHADGPDALLWRALVEREAAFYLARAAFMNRATDRTGALQAALRSVAGRATALRLVPILPVAERQALFQELVTVASVGHRDVQLVRDAIHSLPRDWVIDHVEQVAEPLLHPGGHEEYRRLLELYSELDPGLTRRLASRAARHADSDIREAGEDFLHWLEDAPG